MGWDRVQVERVYVNDIGEVVIEGTVEWRPTFVVINRRAAVQLRRLIREAVQPRRRSPRTDARESP